MRRLALAAAALLAACSTRVDPTNPWDPETPAPQQARATISGVLTANDEPVVGAWVYLTKNGVVQASTLTSAEVIGPVQRGGFVFGDLVPGNYVVEAARTGFQSYVYPITLAAGQTASFEAKLEAASGVQLGTLKGVALLDGEVLHGGILVELLDPGSGESAGYTTVTASDGGYQLPVAPGTYDLHFVRADFASATQEDVQAVAGQTSDVDDVLLAIDPATVTAHVYGETPAGGVAPLEAASVFLQGSGSSGETEADGLFSFNNVRAGSYLLRVKKTGYLDVSVPVIGLEGGEVRNLDATDEIVLHLGRGSVTGTVQLADSTDASGAIVEATGTGVATVTGASGAFVLDGLLVNTYEITIRREGYAPAVRPGISVTAGAAFPLGTIQLVRTGGTIAIAQGAVTNARSVTVQLNATTAAGYRISEDPSFADASLGDTLGSPASPRAYAGPGSTHPFTLQDLDGRRTVYVVFYDAVGTASTPATASIVLDRTAPAAPSVVIEEGAAYTKAAVVGLALSAQDLPGVAGAEVAGLDQVQLANNAAFTSPTTLAFAVSTTWSIGSGDGAKTVYVRFTDKAGNVSAPASASITLDTTSPSAVSVALSGGAGVPDGYAGSPLVNAELGATDANAGPGGENLQVKLSNSSGLGGATWQPFAATVPWFVTAGDGAKTVYAQVMDPAGNTSVVANGTITLAATPPSSGSLVVDGGAAATRGTSVAATVSATGATQMRFFVNGAAATGWIPYATSHTVPLGAAPDEAVATVSVNFRNAAFVEGGSASATIVVDRRAPTGPSVAVNGGAAFAGATAVTLTLSAVDSPATAGGAVSGLDRVEVAHNAAFTGSSTFAYATSLPWTLAAGADGARTVYVRFLDRAGNTSAAASASVTLDTTPPTSPTIALTGNAEAQAGQTGTPVVTAALSAADANGGTNNANLEVRVSNDLGFAASSWQPFAASTAWVLAPGDGLKTVYAQFRDRAGNVSQTASGTITLASAPPSSGSIVVEGGAEATRNTTLAVALGASGATQMRLFLNGAAATGWVAYATSATLNAAALPDETPAVVSVTFRNAGGVEGGSASATILVDRRAPTSPSVVIADGAAYAAATGVVLTVAAVDAPATTGTASGVASVEVANNSGFTGSTTSPIGPTVLWTLPAGDGAKTVYARFRDAAGNLSVAASDTIVLDTTPPSATSIALAGNAEAAAGTTGTPIVTATLSATDANEGTGKANLEVRVSNDLGFAASSWQPYASTMAWVLTPGDGAKTVYAQFRDRAGNVSTPPASAAITLAGTAPTNGTIVVEGGAAATNKASVAVALSATNATQMRLFVNGAAATGWVAYATSTTVSLAALPDETPATVAVSYRGAGGVEGGGASATILVDRRAPTAPSVAVSAGAAYAGSTAVTLTVSAVDTPLASGTASGLDRIQVSNDNFATSTTLAVADTLPWTLAAGADGARTVYVRYLDRAGNVSSIASDGITLDTTAPAAGTLALTGNAEAAAGNTGTPVVTAAVTTSDTNGGPGNANLEVQLSNSSGFAGATWQAFTSSLAWVLLPGDGAKTVYARFRDPAGNVSTFVQANITLATAPPTSGSIVVEGGAAATNKSAVALNVALGATGATQMRLSVNGAAVTGWIAYATSTTVAAAGLPDETPATIAVAFRNAGGVDGGAASTSILVDRRAPTSPSVTVSGGATYAGGTAVTLAVSALDTPATTGTAAGLASVEVANNAAFTGSTTFPMADTLSWSLAAGADGARTVYARFRDRAGNVSATASDGITLDVTAPATGSIALTGNPEAQAGYTGTPIVSAALTTSDTNGGAGNASLEVQLSNVSSFAGASWQPFTTPVSWVLTPGDGAKTVYARFRDPAGNVSTYVQADITLAATPPSNGTLVLAGGATATSTQTVAAAVSATSATHMRFYVNGVADARGWITPVANTTVDLGATPNEATRVVSVSFRNVGGAEGGGTSASIRYDTLAPNAGSLAITGTLGNGTTSATLTATPAVVLSAIPFTTNADVTQMAIVQASTSATACSTMFASPSWQAAATSQTFVLSGADGAKRLCLLFRDSAGNFSAANAVAANITLDTTPPTNPAFVNVVSTTQNSAVAPRTGNPTITAATDTNGVTYQCVGGYSPGYGAQWADCGAGTTLPRPWNLVPNSENTLGVRARDNAYNYSPGSFARIVHDDVAPTPPFIVELRSSRDTVTVIWDTTADADVTDYVVHYGSSPGALTGTGAAQGASPISVGPRQGQASGSFTLTGLTQGIPYYVAVEAVDAAGNRSGPSGERSAVPNKANPRLISSVSPSPRTLGYRTTATQTFVYVGTNQGITQLNATSSGSTFTSGRAFLPDMVPTERSRVAVFDCTKGGTAGHCVVPSGTTLEGDYRDDYDFYRAAAPVVFFPLTGTAAAPAVGTIESILPVRPTHVVPYTTGGTTYLAAIDTNGVRVFTVSPTNPSLVRQVASLNHAAPVLSVLTAGLNASELYVVARVDSRYFGGPSDYPLVFGYELADVQYGDLYPLFDEHGLRDPGGNMLGDLQSWAADRYPAIVAEGGLYAAYLYGSDAVVSSYNPYDLTGTPASTTNDPVAGPLVSDASEVTAAAFGAGQLMVWASDENGYEGVYQVGVSGLTLTKQGSLALSEFPDATLLASTRAGVSTGTAIFTVEPSVGDPNVRAVRRWSVSGQTIASAGTALDQIRPEHFAWSDHVMYVSQRSTLYAVDVSNPYTPSVNLVLQPAAAYRYYGKLVTHGRFLYAAATPGTSTGGVAIFRMTGSGGLTSSAAPLRVLSLPSGVGAVDLAVVGRWLFVLDTGGDLWAYNLAPTNAYNNPALVTPVQIGTAGTPLLAGAFTQLEARRDTSGAAYEAVLYVTNGDELETYGFNGTTLTTLSAGVTFAASGGATSLDLAGNYAVVGTSAGSYLLVISSPGSPYTTGASVYPIAGPTKLQAGYLVGLAPSGDPSGPAFLGRGAGAVDGSLRFSTCTGGANRSIAHRDGYYAASCGKNGIALFAPGALEGMRLLKSFDVASSWIDGAAYASDGMLSFLGGPTVWNGTSYDSSRLFVVSEESTAEGSVTAPSWVTNLSGAETSRGTHFMETFDGVLYVVNHYGSTYYLDAYEATTPYGFISRLPIGTTTVTAMVTDGEYVYLGRFGTGALVEAYDVRNPADMFLRASNDATLGANSGKRITALALSRDKLYGAIAQGSQEFNDINVWDVSTVQTTGGAGTLVTNTRISAGGEGGITGLAVAGSTVLWTVHDPIYRAPLYGLGIGRLGPNRDGSDITRPAGYGLVEVPEPLQSPIIAGDQAYLAANLGLQAWDLRGWFTGSTLPHPGGGVSLADPLRLSSPVKLRVEGPFAYLTGGTFRAFDLR